MRRFVDILAMGMMVALLAAAPAHAFDPPDHKKNRNTAAEQRAPDQTRDQTRDRARRPSTLYPEDVERRRTIEQFMLHDRARNAVESGAIRPLGDIRRAVKRQFKGRIVGVDLFENRRGRGPDYIYDVRVLTKEGDVLAVQMDAVTGQIIDVRGKR